MSECTRLKYPEWSIGTQVPCGRPTKGDLHDGNPICRTCLSGIRRTQKKRNEKNAALREQTAHERRTKKVLGRLGIKGRGTIHGDCIVNLDELEEATKLFADRNVLMRALSIACGFDDKMIHDTIDFAEQQIKNAK